MASRLSWLTTCKLAQLKRIANATGINCSGTKPLLTTRLLDELPQSRFAPAAASKNGAGSNKSKKKEGEDKANRTLISIDMGIRNLAYCRLILPSSTAARPTCTHWTRIAISRKQALTSPKTTEAFDPQTYAAHAYALVTHTLLPLNPSQILIERQRFRSMGGSSVQEWTLRVNMFEAMLYAVLKTVREQGLWRGEVHAVPPSKVAKFWVGDGEVEEEAEVNATGKGKKGKSAKTKNAKIELVGDWLSRGDVLKLEHQAGDMAKAYIAKRDGGRKVMVARPSVLTHTTAKDGAESNEDHVKEPPGELQEELGKLDDLADCLLQGMGWWQWEGNRRKVLEKGIEVLDEL